MGTYTEILKQSNPDINKLGWHIDWYRNQNITNHVIGSVMENNFVVSGGNLSGPSGLNINIDETVVEIYGVQYTIAAGTLVLTEATVNPEETNWIYVNDAGAITVTTSPPAARGYCPIGLVDTDATAVLRVADLRVNDSSGFNTPVENDFQNGCFDVWQRYSGSLTAIAAATDQFIADRVGNYRTAGSSLTVSKEDFTPGQVVVPGNPNHYHKGVFVTDSASTEENYHFIRIKDVERYSGKTVAFKIHASVDSAKDIALEATQNFGSGGSASVQASVDTISLTTSFVKNIIYVTFPSISGKTVGTLSYSEFKLWLSAGSSFNVNTNSLGNQSGTFNFSEVEIYESTKEHSVRRRSVGESIKLCEGYCEKTYGLNVAPGAIVANNQRFDVSARSTSNGAGIVSFSFVRKASTPSITFYSPATGTPNTIRFVTSEVSVAAANIGQTGCTIQNNSGGALTDSSFYTFHALIDGEI